MVVLVVVIVVMRKVMTTEVLLEVVMVLVLVVKVISSTSGSAVRCRRERKTGNHDVIEESGRIRDPRRRGVYTDR